MGFVIFLRKRQNENWFRKLMVNSMDTGLGNNENDTNNKNESHNFLMLKLELRCQRVAAYGQVLPMVGD